MPRKPLVNISTAFAEFCSQTRKQAPYIAVTFANIVDFG